LFVAINGGRKVRFTSLIMYMWQITETVTTAFSILFAGSDKCGSSLLTVGSFNAILFMLQKNTDICISVLNTAAIFVIWLSIRLLWTVLCQGAIMFGFLVHYCGRSR